MNTFKFKKSPDVHPLCSFYRDVRKASGTTLVDGTGHRPHYSLRTLCRALRFAASNPCSNIQRSLYEVFLKSGFGWSLVDALSMGREGVGMRRPGLPVLSV